MWLGNVDGIEFFDDVPTGTRAIAPIAVGTGGFFSDEDDGDPSDLMKRLARRAKSLGADSIVEFKVERHADGWLTAIHRAIGGRLGRGTIAVVRPPEQFTGKN